MEDIKIEDMDLYELLETGINSSVSDIKKAYRKKALQCHPDKNPDDPNAGKKFHLLSKVLEVLTDEAARSAYDKVLKGKKEAALRHKELDSKRRKLKEDLELREKQAEYKTKADKTADQLLKEEIERLRKEGSKAVEEEITYVPRKLLEERNQRFLKIDTTKYRIKVKWSANKHDETDAGYFQEMYNFFSKYGDIQALVISPKKKGSALIEFKDTKSAEMAVDLEIGLPTNPLKLEWVHGSTKSTQPTSSLIKDSDFDSVTLTKLRQAEERKKLISDDGRR